LSLKQKGIVN